MYVTICLHTYAVYTMTKGFSPNRFQYRFQIVSACTKVQMHGQNGHPFRSSAKNTFETNFPLRPFVSAVVYLLGNRFSKYPKGT